MKEDHQIIFCLVQLSIKKTSSYNSSKTFLHEFFNQASLTLFFPTLLFNFLPSPCLKCTAEFSSLLHPSTFLLFLPPFVVHIAFYFGFFAHFPPQRFLGFGMFIQHHEQEIKWNRVTEVRVYCTAETGKVVKSIIFLFSFLFLSHFLSLLPTVFCTFLLTSVIITIVFIHLQRQLGSISRFLCWTEDKEDKNLCYEYLQNGLKALDLIVVQDNKVWQLSQPSWT